MSILKRKRGRRAGGGHTRQVSKVQDCEIDARDEIAKFENVNHPSKKLLLNE